MLKLMLTKIKKCCIYLFIFDHLFMLNFCYQIKETSHYFFFYILKSHFYLNNKIIVTQIYI